MCYDDKMTHSTLLLTQISMKSHKDLELRVQAMSRKMELFLTCVFLLKINSKCKPFFCL